MRVRTMAALGMVAVGAMLIAAVSAASGSAPRKYTATLTAAQEVPKPAGAAGAGGTFTATLTGTTLKWTLTYKHLSGAAQQAHIHMGAKGVSGNVVVPLCSTPAGCASPIKGSAKLNAATIKAMNAGNAYVNVHTKKNLAGEIRGQIK